MPRQRRLRKVVAPPKFKGFKPYGTSSLSTKAIELLYEEYEAIKLADYDSMNHQEASELMGVSRATFARIYESARQKMAKALVEVKEIKSIYGNAEMDESWYVCNECHARFTMPPSASKNNCALCKSSNIESLKK